MKRILLVDDDSDWRWMARAFLAAAGYAVVTAADATQALVETGGLKPDVIVLDVNLAGEDGLMLMKFLNQNYPEVPIILYTGIPHDDAAIQTMLKQGANRYVPKGTMEDLLTGVQGALDRI
jgi:two-component system nitrogen regulation response regulator GlnG